VIAVRRVDQLVDDMLVAGFERGEQAARKRDVRVLANAGRH
jgi:hypothetical protein